MMPPFRQQLLPALLLICAAGQATSATSTVVNLTPSDGAPNDFFGTSVGIFGTTAIISSFRDDDSGESSGSAYLFDTTTGTQIAKLTASDGDAIDYFGGSVAISGTTAIVAARRDDDIALNSGAAYLFDTTTGTQIAKLKASDAGHRDDFGSSVAISGTTAVVGAAAGDTDVFLSGSAYLFDTTTGIQIAKLAASDGAYFDRFGDAVAISGTTAIVGAYGDDDNGEEAGSAYIFDTTTGTQIAKLSASDGAAGDKFGIKVAIYGTTAIVGAYGDDDKGNFTGSVYLFDTTTGTQIAKLTASDGAENDYFGSGLAMSDTSLIVTAWGDDANIGSAYLYSGFAETTAPVPLPAGVWLLGSALGLIAVKKRRS